MSKGLRYGCGYENRSGYGNRYGYVRNMGLGILSRDPTRASPDGRSATTRGNRSTRRKSVVYDRVKLDNILRTCDQGNFYLITAQNQCN